MYVIAAVQCTPNYAPIEPPPSYEASLEGSVSRLNPIVEETSFMMGNSVEDDNGQAATTADIGKKKVYLMASFMFGVLIMVLYHGTVSWFIYEQINYAARSDLISPVDDEHD